MLTFDKGLRSPSGNRDPLLAQPRDVIRCTDRPITVALPDSGTGQEAKSKVGIPPRRPRQVIEFYYIRIPSKFCSTTRVPSIVTEKISGLPSVSVV